MAGGRKIYPFMATHAKKEKNNRPRRWIRADMVVWEYICLESLDSSQYITFLETTRKISIKSRDSLSHRMHGLRLAKPFESALPLLPKVHQLRLPSGTVALQNDRQTIILFWSITKG